MGFAGYVVWTTKEYAMEKELMEQHVRELSAEIVNAGFPYVVLADLRRELRGLAPGYLTLPFTDGLGRSGVTGSVYLEPEWPSGFYRFRHFDVDLGQAGETLIRQQTFDRILGYSFNLREAVNLMEGRFIYREPLKDQLSGGYWVSLNPRPVVAGDHEYDYDFSDFTPEKAIRDSLLYHYLLPLDREKLVSEIRQGDRAEVNFLFGGTMRQVFVEAQPRMEQLKLTGKRGERVGLPGLEAVHRGEEMVVKQGRRKVR
jgi:hypothetical protein